MVVTCVGLPEVVVLDMVHGKVVLMVVVVSVQLRLQDHEPDLDQEPLGCQVLWFQ